jgi:5'-deoxynucleotidase
MKNINRWALMRNSYTENVQEHSHMVAVLAHALAVISREMFGGKVDPDHCATVALYHDASEIITGDMPTPVKYHNNKIMSAYKDVERLASEKLLGALPRELQGSYRPLLCEIDPDTERIIKAADKLSAYIKCLEELKAGNGEFRLAASQTKEKLMSYDMPEVEYFMENCIPAFELTLDELNFSVD